MITLIHGENISASLAELERLKSEIKAKQGNIIELDGKKLTQSVWEEAKLSSGLFTEDQLIIISNYFSKPGKKDISFDDNQIELIFYETERISSLPKIPGLLNKKFDPDLVVFKFLESLIPNNQKVILPLFRRYLEAEIPEIILTMIVRQFRLLILAKSKSTEGPADWLNLADWQKSRLEIQVNNYTFDQLKRIYSQLLKIDLENKNGTSPLSLSASLELLLLSL